MPNAAFKSLVEGFNAQLKVMNGNNLKVYDADNPEFFITGIEYDNVDDKLIFKTDADPEALKRIENKI